MMNGKKAKAIRRKIYGSDFSHRERVYKKGHEPEPQLSIVGRLAQRINHMTITPARTVICAGRRRAYQDAKKA
jgi:hypothetical protein